jgi:phosphatidylglycerophosphate synthase
MTKSQLFLLEDKLKKIRRNRKISGILAFLLIFVGYMILSQYWINFITYLVWGTIVVVFYQIVKRYYNMKEKQVLRQIEKLRLWKGDSEQ